MIVYGTRGKVLGTAQILTGCTSCGQSPQVLSIYQRYVHIFWVPLFPLRKSYILQCSHCKKATHEKELPAVEQERFREKKREFKTPVWLFAGLFLLACLFGYIGYDEKMAKARSDSYLQSPQVGDYYVVKVNSDTGSRTIRVLKLVEIQSDNLRFQESNYAYPSSSSASTNLSRDMGKHADFFAAETFLLPKNNVGNGQMTIEQVIRK